MVRFGWGWWGLGLLLGLAAPVWGQGRLPPPKVQLRESLSSATSPLVTIPFEIHPEVCTGGHQPVVSLRIFNVLVQVVGVPVLDDSGGERLENLRLRCGPHVAYWDGKYLDGRREASTGVYYYQLTIDGERFTKKLLVTRPSETR